MLFSILIFSVVLTQSFGYGGGKEPDPRVCGDRLCSEIPGGRDAWENKETIPFTIKNEPLMASPSLKTQIKNGISPDFLTCTDGFELIFKSSDNSPACVKPETKDKLFERDWGYSGYKIIFITEKNEYKVGEEIKITMKNVGIFPIFSPGGPIGFILHDSNDNEICDWKGVNEVITYFQPNEEESKVWKPNSDYCNDPQLKPGKYFVVTPFTESANYNFPKHPITILPN